MIDWTQVGAAITAVGIGAGGIYAWFLKSQKNVANTRADVAEANTQAVTADAQSTVYRLMLERVTTLEQDMRNVRAELTLERAHSRRQDNYIWQLIRLMRAANMDVPPFAEVEG